MPGTVSTAKNKREAIASSAFSSFSTNDAKAALDFYQNILGLTVSETKEGLQISFGSGSDVFIYVKEDHEPATFTVLNFPVSDIDAAVDELSDRGVIFEDFDGNIKTDDKHIFRGARSDDGPNIAWFRDPAGNFLSLIED
ncbi:MAG: VOC family protein [Acidobacteria bacterium]|nr:VOC family protein [Acidobacteriota bacterium]